jgi:predicted KAP-like P-loop ATPase
MYGAWGSGKSSVKNLILERLAEEKYKLAPIEFNPWLAPGVEKITETFFTEIGVKLFGETDESDKHRAAKWKRYADYLKIGSYVATVTAPALVEKGIRFLEGKAAGRADSFEKKENSVQQMRKDLREAFQSLNTPIVIVIDDIDRLTEEEINLIFRLVKANADFPVRRRIICESFSAIYEWWRISLCSTIVCCRGLRPKTTVC